MLGFATPPGSPMYEEYVPHHDVFGFDTETTDPVLIFCPKYLSQAEWQHNLTLAQKALLAIVPAELSYVTGGCGPTLETQIPAIYKKLIGVLTQQVSINQLHFKSNLYGITFNKAQLFEANWLNFQLAIVAFLQLHGIWDPADNHTVLAAWFSVKGNQCLGHQHLCYVNWITNVTHKRLGPPTEADVKDLCVQLINVDRLYSTNMLGNGSKSNGGHVNALHGKSGDSHNNNNKKKNNTSNKKTDGASKKSDSA